MQVLNLFKVTTSGKDLISGYSGWDETHGYGYLEGSKVRRVWTCCEREGAFAAPCTACNGQEKTTNRE